MASISEQARQGFLLALTTPSLVPGALKVERAREDPYSERESGSINIKAEDEQTRMLGAHADDNEETVAVEVYVRPADGENWETKADAILVAAHARILSYANWPDGVARVRKTGKTPRSEQGDRTPGLFVLHYAVRFVTSAYALDSTPNQP